jgi:hypothetical protein
MILNYTHILQSENMKAYWKGSFRYNSMSFENLNDKNKMRSYALDDQRTMKQ